MAEPLDPDTLEYLVRRDRTVVEVRGPWDDFARANQAFQLTAAAVTGHSLDEFIFDLGTRGIYKALMERVLEGGGPICFPFRCDAPNRGRFMEMSLDLAGSDRVRFRSRVVREEDREAQRLLEPDAPRSDEAVSMCGWCKRVKDAEGAWVEVEVYLGDPQILGRPLLPGVTHGICPACEREMESLLDRAS